MKIKCVACGYIHLKAERFEHPEVKNSMCPKCWCQGFIKLEKSK